ncbi:MAG: hypothetical protein ACRYGA_07870 [Janthinobacterium lividum]
MNNVIANDLIQDAALVSQECLNSLPETVRLRVAEAMKNGGEIEVRARLRTAAPVVSVWLHSPAGEAVLIALTE